MSKKLKTVKLYKVKLPNAENFKSRFVEMLLVFEISFCYHAVGTVCIDFVVNKKLSNVS